MVMKNNNCATMLNMLTTSIELGCSANQSRVLAHFGTFVGAIFAVAQQIARHRFCYALTIETLKLIFFAGRLYERRRRASFVLIGAVRAVWRAIAMESEFNALPIPALEHRIRAQHIPTFPVVAIDFVFAPLHAILITVAYPTYVEYPKKGRGRSSNQTLKNTISSS